MYVQSINDGYNPSMKEIYFTEVYPIFDKSLRFSKKVLNKRNVSQSKNGYKFIENKNISGELKDKYMEIPFVRELSEKYDTFVLNKTVGSIFGGDITYASVIWVNPEKECAQSLKTVGRSALQEVSANEDIINKLKDFKYKERKNYVDYVI